MQLYELKPRYDSLVPVDMDELNLDKRTLLILPGARVAGDPTKDTELKKQCIGILNRGKRLVATPPPGEKPHRVVMAV